MILGLDISTSITGYTVLDHGGNILACDHIDLRKEKNFFKKVQIVRKCLEEIEGEYPIEQVYIEESLQSFNRAAGKSLSILSKINGIVSWLCYNMFYGEPKYFGARSARKLCGITIPRGSKAKMVTFQFVVDSVPGFEVQYTRHGNPKAGYTDRSDSYVIAKAGWLNERDKTQNPD